MRVLLGFAALVATAPISPAQAQSFSTATFGTANARPWVTTMPPAGRDRRSHRDGRMHRGIPAAAYGYVGGYYDYGDFDGNRSFDPDKWNDWWHDRPERAYPRWMTRNQDCARRWYSADLLTC